MFRILTALAALTFATTASARDSVTDKGSCLSYLAEAVQISDSIQFMPGYHAKVLSSTPESAAQHVKAMMAAYEEISSLYEDIAREAEMLCRQFD